ncbi:hypothetical protein AB205_0221300 [Aquarana catesbeiana]|uniref:Conserved oligomeric Golgi complex subunit 1 n=1 Tax=Aquarana catesbeiana TaxID=8400 RepID=A0A2G9R9S2_AQUCT|nr:hypothetical protein AB205_0221300 [Aquarana catesbeiana]
MAAGRLSEMRDPGTLFEAHSAEEIRALEKKVRAEIEQKKEELRQMVGERYRDLIEAADTIGEMRRSAEQVLGAVRGLETYCGGLRAKPGPLQRDRRGAQVRRAVCREERRAVCREERRAVCSSIKSQVCSLVELLANTLYQAHALFYTAPDDVPPNPSLNCGLLFSMLETVTAQQGGGALLYRRTLMKEGLESISNDSIQLLQSSLQELEVNTESMKHVQCEGNICSFLWSENQNDLPPDAAWVNVGSRSAHCRSGLSLKAQAVTPCILTFCQALDSKLKVKLEDLFSYLPQEASEQQSKPAIAGLKLSAFDRYGDANTVQEMLSQLCLTCMQHIQDSIKAQLQVAAEAGPTDQSHGLSSSKLSTVLFLARLCQSLGELCPHLKQCILGKSGSLDISIREPRSAKKMSKGKVADKPHILCKWQELKDKLIRQSLEAYSIWRSAVVQHVIRSFSQTLLLNAAGSALVTATHWDEIEIQEETEAGSSVTSKIFLPGQCSWYVQSLLFSLCQAVNRVGGHTIPKVTLQELLRTCLEEVISTYEKLCQESTGKQKHGSALTQARALQLLFDLRYICLILGSRSEDGLTSKNKPDPRVQKVADQLESCIDPFDLDVFTPHLNTNLNRLAQRTSVG